MSDPIYTEKQCSVCGHVFERYLDHGNIAPDHKKEQKWCSSCGQAQFVVAVQKPGESL